MISNLSSNQSLASASMKNSVYSSNSQSLSSFKNANEPISQTARYVSISEPSIKSNQSHELINRNYLNQSINTNNTTNKSNLSHLNKPNNVFDRYDYNEEDNLEKFHVQTANNYYNDYEENDDLKEEFPGGSTLVEKNDEDFAPIPLIHNLDNSQPQNLTDSFTGRGSNPHQAKRNNSLYHPDLDRRKSALIVATFLQTLENIEDDNSTSEERNHEEERKSHPKRKFNDNNILRDSLARSLKITHKAKKVDRHSSLDLSKLLNQSLLSLGSLSKLDQQL